MTFEDLTRLVYEELDPNLSNYLWFEYKENLGDKFIGHLWVLYNMFCRTDQRAWISAGNIGEAILKPNYNSMCLSRLLRWWQCRLLLSSLFCPFWAFTFCLHIFGRWSRHSTCKISYPTNTNMQAQSQPQITHQNKTNDMGNTHEPSPLNLTKHSLLPIKIETFYIRVKCLFDTCGKDHYQTVTLVSKSIIGVTYH
jgi:hypothetical protein